MAGRGGKGLRRPERGGERLAEKAQEQRGGDRRRRRRPRDEGMAGREVPGKEWRRKGLGSGREARTEPICTITKTISLY